VNQNNDAPVSDDESGILAKIISLDIAVGERRFKVLSPTSIAKAPADLNTEEQRYRYLWGVPCSGEQPALMVLALQRVGVETSQITVAFVELEPDTNLRLCQDKIMKMLERASFVNQTSDPIRVSIMPFAPMNLAGEPLNERGEVRDPHWVDKSSNFILQPLQLEPSQPQASQSNKQNTHSILPPS
jgi:hypothetical protein